MSVLDQHVSHMLWTKAAMLILRSSALWAPLSCLGYFGSPCEFQLKPELAWFFIWKLQFPWMHRGNSAHWCCMKPLCKIHSHFLQVSVLRVVKVHNPVIPLLAHGEAHTITLLLTALDSCCLLQLFSIPPSVNMNWDPLQIAPSWQSKWYIIFN